MESCKDGGLSDWSSQSKIWRKARKNASEFGVDFGSDAMYVIDYFMKKILLFLCAIVVFFQSGCATRPSINEQSLQDQSDDQAKKRSDAFARGLAQ
jgi:hypothetical protein